MLSQSNLPVVELNPPPPIDQPVMKDWCCIIESNLLGEKIVLVSQEPHVERARMLYPEKVVYTCEEITRLEGVSQDTVREIHDVKKTFNGCFLQMI